MRQNSGTLADSIVQLVRSRRLPHQITVAHIRPIFTNQFAGNHINAVLANYAEGGNMVLRGQRPRFRRVSKGLYQIL